MSETVSWVLEAKVKDGAFDDAKALMDEMSAATQADEPGALAYEWFASEDKTKICLYERYADSAATMVHLGNFGSKFADRMMALMEPKTPKAETGRPGSRWVEGRRLAVALTASEECLRKWSKE